MKFHCALPERKHYQIRQIKETNTEKIWFWEDKASSKLRIRSKIANPWEADIIIQPSVQSSKSDAGKYHSDLILRCIPLLANTDSDEYCEAILERKIIKSCLAFSANSPISFYAFPLKDRENHFVQYSFFSYFGKEQGEEILGELND